MKNQKSFFVVLFVALMALSFTSCEKDEEVKLKDNEGETGLITLNKYEVDFGVVERVKTKSAADSVRTVVLTLVNNADSVLNGLTSYIEFEGDVDINMNFKPVQPGDSISVEFTYTPGNSEPGVYTGKAMLIPSFGDTIEVKLMVTIVEPGTTNPLIVMSAYSIDFGTFKNKTLKAGDEPKEVVLTLTNKSNTVLTKLSSSIEFPGQAGVNLSFSPLEPGQSIDVPFTYSPSGLAPGEYTGKATLTPSIGEPIVVELKASVEV